MSDNDPLFAWVKDIGIPRVGIACRTSFSTHYWDADLKFHAASMMKAPVMMEAFHRDAEGDLPLDSHLDVVNCFSSIVDGTPYALSPEDDSDTSLYGRLGSRTSVRELVEIMIARSGNLATNILVQRLGASAIDDYAKRLGADDVRFLRGVEDGKAFRAGLNNTMTARSFLVLMERLTAGEAVSEAASEEMLSILSRQEHNEAIPSGLPPGTRVAHKTGWNDDYFHDGGVVFKEAEPLFSLAVFTQGAESKAHAETFVGEVAKRLFKTFQ